MGEYSGIAGRVFARNADLYLVNQFCGAWELLEARGPASNALQILNRINGLGRPSFASKHSRFLDPHRCPVLDSVLSGTLRYRLDAAGYQAFCNDCYSVAVACPNQSEPVGSIAFGAADVEMAIFSCLFHP
jgi:hypothetical protein